MKNHLPISGPVLWLLLATLSAVSMEFYTARIWSANQPAGFSDLYARWWGAHELLLHGRDPYSPAVSHEIQTVIYGAPVVPSPDDPTGIGGGFAYPPYAALLFWPTINMSFPGAQKVFLCVSLGATLLSLAFWMRAVHPHSPPMKWLAVSIFTLGSFPALQALKLQNPSLIGAALIAVTLYFLSANRLVLAGGFLAASTFKPQFTVALILWLALWTLADWRRRRPMAYSFLASMLVLAAVSERLVPGWIPSFLNTARAYRNYAYGHSLLDVWLTPTIGPIASAVLLLGTLVLCWPCRSHSADSPKFLLATSLMLAANVVVIPTLAPHAQLLLLPGFLCLLPGPTLPGASNSLARRLRVAAWMLLTWPWIAAFALLLAGFRYPVAVLTRFWQVPLYTSPLLPLAVLFALSGLLLASPHPPGQALPAAPVPTVLT